MFFASGDRVLYRGLAWQVIGAEPCGAQIRVRLRCAQGEMAGLDWDALYPWDQLEPSRLAFRFQEPAAVAGWFLYHTAHWLDRVRDANPAIVTHPGRMAIEPWQTVALLRAFDMPRPRLLLADGVGLGKTVQACLIAAELIRRRRAHRIIVVTPAGPLLAQWAAELRTRFGLRPTILADAAELRGARTRQELGGNPFDSAALCLTSLDFAKQDAVLAELERTSWDLAIIDEAHHCFADTQAPTHRRKLAEVLAQRADGLLLLSATPHDGQDGHFASLMALLDPALVDKDGRLLGQGYRRHVVRRLKSHIRDPATGVPQFRPRVILPVAVTLEGPALRFHQALADLMAPRLRRSGRGRLPAETLAFVGLLKRSVSSIAACLHTLGVVADRYQGNADDPVARKRDRTRALLAYRRRTLRHGVLTPAEEAAQAAWEAEGIAADLHEAGAADIAAGLQGLMRLGRAALDADPKLRALTDAIRAIRADEPDANILVYTEYADSQDSARDALCADPALGEVLTISGADPDEARALAADRFSSESGLVLIGTDSLAEGLNLQWRCHHLIHLDLPYNPNRLEQRNGRIDRYGQTRDAMIRYPYLAGTFEERLLLRLIAKYERARTELEFMPDTLGVTADTDALAPGLVQGFAEDQAPLFPPPESPIRARDPDTDPGDAWAGLHREITHAFQGFEGVALRHGWWDGATAGQASKPRTAQVAAACDVTTPLGFLTQAVTASGGTVTEDPSSGDLLCAIPRAWAIDLTGLPGFGRDGLLMTARIDRVRDEAGRTLACPGWAHPLVRHAIERLQAVPDSGPDPRIAVAGARVRAPVAILSYGLESGGPSRVIHRSIFAVRVGRTGTPSIMEASPAWLHADWAAPDRPEAVWERHFAAWLPDRMDAAARAAARAGVAIAASSRTEHLAMIAREAARMERWAERAVAGICGEPAAPIGDLFGHSGDAPAWKAPSPPLDRLEAFIRHAAPQPREGEGATEARASERASGTPAREREAEVSARERAAGNTTPGSTTGGGVREHAIEVHAQEREALISERKRASEMGARERATDLRAILREHRRMLADQELGESPTVTPLGALLLVPAGA